ncbi:MAG TPA: hypothetical protein DCX06_05385 [Opitutae bacterium]|nr:hypothetical protein [Opitutae bacterium]
MRIGLISIFLFLAVGETLVAQSDAYVMQRALQRFTEAYGGGRDADALTSISIEGVQEQEGKVYDFLLRKKRPNSIRYRMTYAGHSVVAAYDGTTGWMQSEEDGKLITRKLSRVEVKQLKQEAAFEGPLFRHLERRSNSVEMTGRERIDGKDTFVFTTEDSDGNQARYYLGSRDSLILKMERLAADGSVTMTTLYRDYREVEGYPFAFEIESSIANKVVSSVKIHSISVNSGLLSFYFRMPK